MAVKSMTGFARVDGGDSGAMWHWEMRSVNGRGLDVRVRLPSGYDQLEGKVRERVAKAMTRGNVSLQLYQRRIGSGTELVVNSVALDQVLAIGEELREKVGTTAPTIEGLLGLRGVLDVKEVEEDEDVISARQQSQIADLDRGLTGLVVARSEEGERLKKIIEEQLERIVVILDAVTHSPERQAPAIAERLDRQLQRLLNEPNVTLDPARLHQEALLLAAKADIEEELQRLRAHIEAARELLASDQAIGRRLDFLTQEFNREANTLCSKSNATEITSHGLELKAVIEQMREQVQNIE